MSFSSPAYQPYQSKAIYCTIGGPFVDQSLRSNFFQLSRVQDSTWSIDYGLTQDMYLNGGTESSYNTYTPINLNMAWYNTNGLNEAAIGLGTINNRFFTGALNLDQEQNYYVTINNVQGADEIGLTGQSFVITGSVETDVSVISVYDGNVLSSTIAGSYITGVAIAPETYITYSFPQEQFFTFVISRPGLGTAINVPITVFTPYVNNTTVAMACGVLNSYNLSAQVGSIVQSAASINCLTAYIYTGTPLNGNQPPTVNPKDGIIVTGFSPFPPDDVGDFFAPNGLASGFFNLPSASSQYDPNSPYAQMNVAALGGKDIKLTFPLSSGMTNLPTAAFATVFSGDQACYLNSLNLTLTVNRQEVKPLGYIFPTSRAVLWPVEVEMTAEATVSRYQADQLQRIDCTATGVTIDLSINQPYTNTPMFGFWSDRMQLANQTFSNSIGARDKVTFTWKGIINNPSNLIFYGDTTNPW